MQDLKKQIARKKFIDRTFAVVGLLSIVVALATLATLMTRLVVDARPALRVPEGSVEVTSGKVKNPDGSDMSPDQVANEVRKIAGATLLEMRQHRKDGTLELSEKAYELIVMENFINVAKFKELAKDGALAQVIKDDKLGPAISGTEHVKKVVAEGRTADLLGLERFVPRARAAHLKEQHVEKDLLNLEKIRQMVETPDGFISLLNVRRIRSNAAIEVDKDTGQPKPSVFQSWIARNEFEANFRRLIKDDELAALLNAPNVLQFIDNEYTFAKSRPTEFNSSFFFRLGPSASPETTGVLVAWIGSFFVIMVTMLVALPLGVAAGVYMEEYGRKNKLTALIEINIANLAGVPSIIYGLMALGFFVYQLHMNRSVGTAGLTLALLVLPIVIMSTREAIRAIPQHIREASFACGATKWQTVRYHILPYSSGGILTGSIIGLSRAIGETAPLITVGAATFLTTLPAESFGSVLNLSWIKAPFTAMPLQMFNLTQRPEPEFHHAAALAGILLIIMTLTLNGVAIYMRYRLRKAIKW